MISLNDHPVKSKSTSVKRRENLRHSSAGGATAQGEQEKRGTPAEWEEWVGRLALPARAPRPGRGVGF